MIVSAAVQEDVDCLGLSILSGAHEHIVPRLRALLDAAGAGDMLLVVGGTIPVRDEAMLRAEGVAAVFGPGMSLALMVEFIRGHVGRRELVAG